MSIKESKRNGRDQSEDPGKLEGDFKDKIDYLFKVIGRFDFYINSTNTKGSLILAWNGLLIGSLIIKYDVILGLFSAHQTCRKGASVLLFCMALAAAISNVMAFRVVFPFLQSSSQFIEPKSLVFFGSVARFGSAEYNAKIRDISKDEFAEDLSDQAVTLAKGLHTKMLLLQKSIIAIYCELISVVVLLVIKLLASFF